jgi:methylthioribose-1-phosphate isomerase
MGARRRLGVHGKSIIEEISARKGGAVVNILTHCNAGWLAFVDVGSATAPIYAAHDAGVKVHVYVDETRPRNQGASLTVSPGSRQHSSLVRHLTCNLKLTLHNRPGSCPGTVCRTR